MTARRRHFASLAVVASQLACGQAGRERHEVAAPARDVTAGSVPMSAAAPVAVPAAEDVPAAQDTVSAVSAAKQVAPGSEPAAKPAPALTPGVCVQLRRRVEQELAAAQRCKDTDECVAIGFEYAFRPCGTV